ARFANEAITEINDGTPQVIANGVYITASYARKGIGQLRDYTASVAADLTSANAISVPVAELLAQVGGTEGTDTKGRVESCYRYYNPGSGNVDEIRIRIYGTDKENEYDVVTDVEGLRCATGGSVEGATCALSEFSPGTITSKTHAANADTTLGY